MLATPAFAQAADSSAAAAWIGLLQVGMVLAFIYVLFRLSRSQSLRLPAYTLSEQEPQPASGPMQFGEADVRAAYDQGLADLTSAAPVGGRDKGPMFLLPYSVVAVRNDGFTEQTARYPDYASLIASERAGVRIIFMALTAADDGRIDDWFAANRTNRGLVQPARDLLHWSQDHGEEALGPERLRFDFHERQEAGARVPGFPAITIMYVCTATGLSDRPPAPGPGALHGEDPNFLSELEKLDDCEVWHLILDGFNYDLEVTWRTVDWIVRQPACDTGTAALAFLRICGEDFVGQAVPDLERPARSGNDAAVIAANICLRSESTWFDRAELSLQSVGEGNDQTPLLERLLAREAAAGGPREGHIPVPRRLLSHLHDGRPPDTVYRVEPDCTVWRLEP